MIAVKNLTFSYNSNCPLRFPDFSCDALKTVLITGNSGVGKTTLLHLLAGMLRPTSGEISIDGNDIGLLSNKSLDKFRGRNIGIVLQQNHFVESLSVIENVILASWLVDGKKKTEEAKKILEYLDLAGQIHKLPSQLSVGQQQRVSIARALINKPKLVLADEPTSSLDDANTQKVANLLEKLAQEYQAALVIVTHDSRLKERFMNQISLS